MANQHFARVRLGYHRIAKHGPVTIAVDRATHQKMIVVDVPGLGDVPVQVGESDFLSIGLEIIRASGAVFDFTEPLPEPETPSIPTKKTPTF